MEKYTIEGNVNFYDELYKSLDVEEELEDDTHICLITHLPLTDKHVVMECGHKFNYMPIYYDIVNHKKIFNGMEGSHGKLHITQIRCPYCRKKQCTLLPYYEELGLAKVNGVNFYEPSQTHTHDNQGEPCAYIFPNEHFNPNMPESIENSKYSKCSHHYASQIQLYNYFDELQPITYGDTQAYCYYHKKLMIKHYKAKEKQKEKDEAKAAKLKAKKDIKVAKELEKQQAKEEKQKMKEEMKSSKKISLENVVLGPSNVLQLNEGCIAVLKSGPNKGTLCGCKIKSENMCFRHFKAGNI
jgi:hypothetical protein